MHYRLIAPSGAVLEEGDGEVRVEGGALVVSPELGQPMRIRPLDVRGVDEPAPYVVALRLSEGPELVLSQIGALRTQILADFAAVRSEATVDALLLDGLGTPTVFPGAAYDVPAELRLYDDVLVAVLETGDPQQVRYSFVEAVTTDPSGYRITVEASGRKPLEVHRLAARTSEFLDLLRKRVNDARLRSATLISALLPGLPSMAGRAVAGLLRDGVPARVEDLNAIEPTVADSLLRVATLPDRVACVQALARRGPLWLALHQRTSVRVAATGGHDLSAPPAQRRDHGGSGAAPGGLGGVLTGAVLGAGPDLFGIGGGFGGGLGGDGLLGAAVLGGLGVGPFAGGGMLGGGAAGDARQQQPRHVPDPGRADVAHTDYAALGTSGEEASALGMVFAVIGDALVYEVLNEGDHATYVYDLPPGDPAEGVAAVAAALAEIRFRVAAVYSDAAGVDSRYRDAVERLPHLARLRSGFRGRAIHTDGWEAQLDGLIARR